MFNKNYTKTQIYFERSEWHRGSSLLFFNQYLSLLNPRCHHRNYRNLENKSKCYSKPFVNKEKKNFEAAEI